MIFKRLLKRLADQLPYVQSLKEQVSDYESKLFVPPGHFYSPVVDINEILEDGNSIFHTSKLVHGIDLNEGEQFDLLHDLKEYYKLLSFPVSLVHGKRYSYTNSFYSYSDVIFLFFMIMHNKPKKIIEIGSGYSSAAMLDVNEQFFDNSIDITFIEPYPENLKKIVKPSDEYTLIEQKIQDVDVSIFQSLQRNDLLFIDSTHVAKTNSDVLFELFEILPVLNKGVKIHFHDIFFPLEYPQQWVVNENRSWNELYFLRSFLMYNNDFKIIAFNTYLQKLYPTWFEEHMPLCLKNPGGSCWIEKVA